MKSFRQYLKEMPQSIDRDPDEMHLDDDSIKPAGKFDHEDHYGGDAHYTLVGRSWKGDKDKGGEHPVHHWIAHHDASEVAHMHSRGGNTKDGFFIANETAKHPESKVSAPEFYKMILHSRKVKGIQSGEKQTEGGKSIWERMSHDKELKVTHHDSETGKEIKLQPHWDSNYDHEKPTHLRVRLRNK